jgi:hypothetical protein
MAVFLLLSFSDILGTLSFTAWHFQVAKYGGKYQAIS